MRIYLSGKITGTTDYKERFQDAESKARFSFPSAEIINPVTIGEVLPVGSSWKAYMDLSIDALKKCNAIMMLDGWEDSKGACVEYYLAKEWGYLII